MQSLVWVERIRHRANGEWVADVLDETPTRVTVPVDRLHAVALQDAPPVRAECSERGLHFVQIPATDIDLASWQLGDPSTASALLTKSALTEHWHRVYEYEAQGRHFVVPALCVIAALFGPLRYTMSYLLRPQGLEELCVPDSASSDVRVLYTRDELNTRQTVRGENSRLLSWAWCFPSARFAWNSVWEFANRGILALHLPRARVRFVGHGIARDGVVVLNRLTVQQLTALEEPFEFAPNHPRDLVCSARTPPQSQNDMGGSPYLSRPLSDEEWETIEHLLLPAIQRKGRRKYPTRELVDGINRKLFSGIPWRSLKLPHCGWENAAYHYRLWRLSGAWDAAMGTLDAS